MLYLISYDLKQPDKDYESLYNAIKSVGISWWHFLESVWIVNTQKSVQEVSTTVRQNMDTNDHLLVVDISNQQYNGWLPSKAWDWIRANQ